MSTFASPKDVEWSNGRNPICVKGVDVFAVYSFTDHKLKLLKSSETVQVSLHPFNYELFTISPVTVLPEKSIQFAPIGLVNMLNSGGAIQSMEIEKTENLARIGVRGSGEMRVFASEKPARCKIDGEEVEFGYEDNMVRLQLAWPASARLSMVEYSF